MSIPIKSDKIIFTDISGANIFADYLEITPPTTFPGVNFQVNQTNFIATDPSVSYGISMSFPSLALNLSTFNLIGYSGYSDYTAGLFSGVTFSGQNFYQTGRRVIDEGQTGLFYPASNPSGFTTGGGGAGVSNIYEIRFFT